VALNCAAIPAELLESELFGHVKGAFSGAVAPRLGKFREAHEGTLFLDEIGDMPLSMQSKLLRVLQERVITPVGGTGTQKVNVRLLAATHQDLVSRVRAGNFREDLYYRLNVVCITLPPLRERGGDIILLAEHFLKTAASEGTPKKLSSSACQALMAHRWPGNARELQNLMQRLTLMVRGPVITAADITLPETHGEHEPWSDLEEMDLSSALAKVERVLITKALASSGGNRTEAARRLGIHRQLLYAKIAEHKLG